MLGVVLLRCGHVLVVGVGVALHQHLLDVHTERVGDGAAHPQPGHDGELTTGRGQIQLADAHQLDRHHIRHPRHRRQQPEGCGDRLGGLRIGQPRRRRGARIAECGDERVGHAFRDRAAGQAGAVFHTARDERNPGGGRRGSPGQAVGGEAAVDGDIGQIDVAQHGVHRAADRCRRREGGLRGAVLPVTDDSGVLEFVVGRPRARPQIQIR